MFSIGLTDHLEGPRDRPSSEIYREVSELVQLADSLECGMRGSLSIMHAHSGHLPTPLLLALHLAGKTKHIHLGSAVLCANLHHPIDLAEQIMVVDLLCDGRLAPGFGSGSTPDEQALFKVPERDDATRHADFERFLRVVRDTLGDDRSVPHTPESNLLDRCWCAVNGVGASRVAGSVGFNVLFSHLRTIEQHREYREAYRSSGGTGQIAMNRPIFVGESDAHAIATIDPALRTLWRRFQLEGKIPANTTEPEMISDLAAHPINFIVGGPSTVARQLRSLHEQFPFDVANLEFRWDGLPHNDVLQSLTRLIRDALPSIANRST